jgi:hypothetical protein
MALSSEYRRVARDLAEQRVESALAKYGDLKELLEVNHSISRGINRDFYQSGHITTSQVELLRRIKKDEGDKKISCPSGKILIEGTIVSVKHHAANKWGSCMPKMIVKVSTNEGSWLCWGTLPSALRQNEMGELLEPSELSGKLVSFEAIVTPSKNDPSFGFFKRPSNARFLEQA